MRIPLVPASAFVLLWAFGYPLGALGVTAMSPMALLAIRFAGSAAALGLIAALTHRTFPRGRMLAHVAVVGLLTQFLQFGCAYLALQLDVPAVIVALVIALNPVATALLAWPVLGTRLRPRQWVGIGVGTAAVLTACLPRVLADASTMGLAVGLVLLALAGVALGGLYQQRFCGSVDLVAGNSIQLGVALIPTAALALATPQTISDPLRAAWVLPTMIILSSMVATTLFLRLVNTAGAAATSMLFTLIPSVSALLGWGMLGQRPDAGIGVGLVLGAASLVIVAGRRTHIRTLPWRCRHPFDRREPNSVAADNRGDVVIPAEAVFGAGESAGR
ncbi:DMT family transporter [Gordonia sp. DT30]|uniref:DMT family transporter n=1 Tax=unclassified Gordonia (in: high G+C Gram-positive bacteria) TaxID=2657482 RepID=UPI003CEB2F64